MVVSSPHVGSGFGESEKRIQYGNQWSHIERSYVDFEVLGAKSICEPMVA